MQDHIYSIILDNIQQILGKNDTFDSDLNKIGVDLFGDLWGGVFPVDKWKPNQKKPYAIVNLDTSDMPGSHWVAIITEPNHILVYDSFGRTSQKILKKLKVGSGTIIDTEYDAEQDKKEYNCGQRSLSALLVYDLYGRNMFLKL